MIQNVLYPFQEYVNIFAAQEEIFTSEIFTTYPEVLYDTQSFECYSFVVDFLPGFSDSFMLQATI